MMTKTAQESARAARTLPATMTAAVQRHYSPPERIATDTVAVPRPRKGEVLIEVHAAGVDRGVWHLATGEPYLIRVLGFGFRRPKQPVMGGEVAGTVVAVGDEVTSLTIGDEVYGAAHGSFAEYAVAKAGQLAIKPPAMPMAAAAASTVSALTAQAAIERASVAPGQRVLVLGASGGVGSFATQFAIAAGGHVTGVASGVKADLVSSLGASRVIDYRTTDVTELTEQFDVIIAAGGMTPVRRLRSILAPTGTLVIVGGEGGGKLTGGFIGRNLSAALGSATSKQSIVSFVSETSTEALNRVGTRIADGQATAAITATYPLARAGEAVVDMAAGRVAGKAVVTIK